MTAVKDSCATCWPRPCGEPPYRSFCKRTPTVGLDRESEVAPLWALCSDCRLSNISTCPQESQCWAPTRTEDLPAEQPT